MDRNTLNVIIFDDDEHSQQDVRNSRTTPSHSIAGPNTPHHVEIIQQEIQYLTDKIKNLEKLAETAAKKKVDSTGGASGEGKQQWGQVVLALQRKIQVVVREIKKLVDRLGQCFEKKLQSKIGNRQQTQALPQIRQNYQKSLRKIEDSYRQQIQRINQRQREQESKMMNRVTSLEQAITNRMNQFSIKEKQYVDWIHHLQRQLQNAPQAKDQPKSRKMIEVTHAKKEQQNSSILTGDNLNSDPSLQPTKSNTSVIHQSSKIQRRHRIFDGVGNNASSSVSPNKVEIPLSSQPQSSKIINPLNKPQQSQLDKKPQSFQQQRSSTFYPQQNPRVEPERRTTNNAQSRQTDEFKPGLVIQRMTEPLKKNNNERQSSPWKVMDTCSVEKSHGEITKRKQIVRDVNASEFYKDVPQAASGWEGFQNYQQNDQSSSNDSEEDVIFYRNEEKEGSRQNWANDRGSERWPPEQSNWGREGSKWSEPKKEGDEKVFSPFDLS